MFTTVEDIKAQTGFDVELQKVQLAQMMIEAWVGRDESEVTDPGDLEILRRATVFQTIYIHHNPAVALEQSAISRQTVGETTTVVDVDKFSPFLSPWAWHVCNKLSWRGTRTVKVGPTFDEKPAKSMWVTT